MAQIYGHIPCQYRTASVRVFQRSICPNLQRHPCLRPLSCSASRREAQQQRHDHKQEQSWQDQHHKAPFRKRLGRAWRETKVEWYHIPVGLGIGFLGILQFYRLRQREKIRKEEERRLERADNQDEDGKPPSKRKRRRVRPSGSWLVSFIASY